MNSGSKKEQEKARLVATLKGAFAGAPTPLKDIPKRNGESRSLERTKPKKRKKKPGK